MVSLKQKQGFNIFGWQIEFKGKMGWVMIQDLSDHKTLSMKRINKWLNPHLNV